MNTWTVKKSTFENVGGDFRSTMEPLTARSLQQVHGGLGLAPDWAGAVAGAGSGAVLGARFGVTGGFVGAGIGLALGAAIGFGYSLATGGGGAKRYSGLDEHR